MEEPSANTGASGPSPGGSVMPANTRPRAPPSIQRPALAAASVVGNPNPAESSADRRFSEAALLNVHNRLNRL